TRLRELKYLHHRQLFAHRCRSLRRKRPRPFRRLLSGTQKLPRKLMRLLRSATGVCQVVAPLLLRRNPAGLSAPILP
ncbi:MAG: hypothetical protein ACO3RV_10465, partial [Luteolibacter sp.]